MHAAFLDSVQRHCGRYFHRPADPLECCEEFFETSLIRMFDELLGVFDEPVGESLGVLEQFAARHASERNHLDRLSHPRRRAQTLLDRFEDGGSQSCTLHD